MKKSIRSRYAHTSPDLREHNRLLYVFEHAELADLKEPQHAVRVNEGNVTEIDLFGGDEGLEGLFKGLFGKLVHRTMKMRRKLEQNICIYPRSNVVEHHARAAVQRL